MKKAIGLYGRSGVGKTQTLNLLIDLLEVATTGCSMPTSKAKGEDRKRTFNYKDLIVCIATGGDGGDVVKANCEYFEKEKADVVFSAMRTRGESCNELRKYAKKYGVNYKGIKRTIVSSNFDIVDLKQAQELFDLI